MRGAAAAVTAVLALAMAVPLPARAATGVTPKLRADLEYRVYFAGARVGGMAVDIGLGPRAYDVKMHLETVGLVGKLFPWWMEAYSRGRVEETGVLPGAAGQRNQWQGEDRWVELRYREGDAVVISAEPAPDEDDRDAVTDKMRRDTLDLASAVLRVILSMDSGRNCSATIPVFDGRRRYDMVLRHRSTDRLSANTYSPYSGPVESCAVTMTRVGGSWRHDDDDEDAYRYDNPEASYDGSEDERGRGWREKDRRAHIWIGRVFDDAPPMPVRLDLETPFGTLHAHLYEAKVDVGGATRRLAFSE